MSEGHCTAEKIGDRGRQEIWLLEWSKNRDPFNEKERYLCDAMLLWDELPAFTAVSRKLILARLHQCLQNLHLHMKPGTRT